MRREFRSYNELFCTLALEEFRRLGVEDVFIAPGSRSTPLVFAAEETTNLRKHVHFDERGLGFLALGCAKKTKKPVVVITTSGTAAANLYPSIIEAELTQVPLIVCTGDRPFELRNTGANQAINQNGMFNHVLEFYDIPIPSAQFPLESLLTTIDNAVFRAKSINGGPVHLNWMFQEPLAPPPGPPLSLSLNKSVEKWMSGDQTFCQDFDHGTEGLVPKEIKDIIQNAKNGLIIVAGQGCDELLAEDFASVHWPVFFDIQSSLRLQKIQSGVPHWDLLLELEVIKPDCVVWFGGAMTNRKGLEFMRELSCPIIQVHPFEKRLDPHHLSKFRIHGSGKPLLTEIRQASKAKDFDRIQALQFKIEDFLERKFKNDEKLSEPQVIFQISKTLESRSLFLASSRPIRDFQRFAKANDSKIVTYSNRGASGIDGNLATIAGIALVATERTVAVVGDLAGLHDLNSLGLIAQSKSPILLIIINNDGGGIFSFLPVNQHKKIFEKYWGTPHGYDFGRFAKAFELNHKIVTRKSELVEILTNFEDTTLVEIQTDREENLGVHQALVENLKAELKT